MTQRRLTVVVLLAAVTTMLVGWSAFEDEKNQPAGAGRPESVESEAGSASGNATGVLAGRALFAGKAPPRRKLVIVEERCGSMEADYSIRVLQSRKKLIAAAPIKDPQTGNLRTKVFTVEALVGEEIGEQAEGATKKVAGQEAARRLLTRLERTLAE